MCQVYNDTPLEALMQLKRAAVHLAGLNHLHRKILSGLSKFEYLNPRKDFMLLFGVKV